MFMFKRLAVKAPDDGGAGGVAPAADPAPAAPETAPAAGAAAPADAAAAPEQAPEQAADTPAATDPAKPAVPETYQPFTLPEGMALDQAALDQFTPVARELGLTQEQAQKLVGLYAGQMAQVQEMAGQAWQQQRQEWQTAARRDPEFGGAKFDENLSLAKRALDQFGGPDLIEALNVTGAGDHPAVLKMFAAVARATGDHKLVSPGASAGPEAMSTAEYYAREVFGK